MQQAFDIIGDSGLEHLSLREVARRLGISHQAPYKHFPSREHLLAAVIGRAFETMAETLKLAVNPADHPQDALARLGRAYLDFAVKNPLHYKLMFQTPMPDLRQHPGLEAKATFAFERLYECIKAIMPDGSEADIRQAALFAWSTVHGLASICGNDALPAIGLTTLESQMTAVEGAFSMICRMIPLGP